MSLILEALKKSEQQRRLGEAPTLGSPVLVARRSRNLLPLFGALIVAALGVAWWLTRTPSTDEADAPKPAAVAAAPAPAPLPASARPAAPDRSANAPRREATPSPAPRQAPNANPATAAPPAASRPATPPTAPAAPKPAAASSAPPRNPPAAEPGAATAKPTAPPVATAAKPAAEGAPAKPDATAATAPKPAPAPAQPALPSVWELPYATRKDLPELPLTMHVFSSVPAERFVVIKGERHVEGDDLDDGVVLKEIRSDGMVLEFKGQRFVYPRDGR